MTKIKAWEALKIMQEGGEVLGRSPQGEKYYEFKLENGLIKRFVNEWQSAHFEMPDFDFLIGMIWEQK